MTISTPLCARVSLFDMYEAAVQSPSVDVDAIVRICDEELAMTPQSLKEDFSGTGYISATFLEQFPNAIAVGLDLDEVSMKHGRRKHFQANSQLDSRMTFVKQDVLNPSTKAMPVDRFSVIFGGNYSFFVFKKRTMLLDYFKTARSMLDETGSVFILEVMGGPNCQIIAEDEPRGCEVDGVDFDFIWRQSNYNPVTNELMAHIDFEFPDGSSISPAFSYDWRFWSVPEIREAMEEAGFSRTVVYWASLYEEFEDGLTADHYSRTTDGRGIDQAEAWLAYVVGVVEPTP
ncbi:methyltransferase [Carpediemonas membranifera]|uniref:Methyltransferase n=1 Tax=Carpediemonas membranifera TaxID=201153 RepID=A0A8J6B8F1_9EUKA|nr:methyltransferase [Carpediemonas membranifera]|eukprot:KAG9394877.1 methyltransferase [Carpediemonas membranifera]